jgi:hypothetical protein
MPAPSAFDYVVIRIVPRVERGEFVNVGVILFSPVRTFLGCAIAIDPGRLRALANGVDLDVEAVTRHLGGLRAICAGEPAGGPIAQLSPSERFHWLSAPRSTVIQTSPVHPGLTEDPAATLAHLFQTLVAPARA